MEEKITDINCVIDVLSACGNDGKKVTTEMSVFDVQVTTRQPALFPGSCTHCVNIPSTNRKYSRKLTPFCRAETPMTLSGETLWAQSAAATSSLY